VTLAYLAERSVLFGQAVREDQVGAETFVAFGAVQATHLRMLVFGAPVLAPGRIPPVALLAGVVAGLAVAGLALGRVSRARRGPTPTPSSRASGCSASPPPTPRAWPTGAGSARSCGASA
jgi:hypothetical protein